MNAVTTIAVERSVGLRPEEALGVHVLRRRVDEEHSLGMHPAFRYRVQHRLDGGQVGDPALRR